MSEIKTKEQALDKAVAGIEDESKRSRCRELLGQIVDENGSQAARHRELMNQIERDGIGLEQTPASFTVDPEGIAGGELAPTRESFTK